MLSVDARYTLKRVADGIVFYSQAIRGRTLLREKIQRYATINSVFASVKASKIRHILFLWGSARYGPNLADA